MHWTVTLEGGPQRVNHAAVAVGHKIFSFGGFCSEKNYEVLYNIDVFVLNTVTLRWRQIETGQNIPDVPFQRYGHSVVTLDRKIYLWGGRSDKESSNTLFVFDTETEKWSTPTVQGTLPEARDGHSACVINRSMYIFAGFLDYSQSYTKDIQVFDIDLLKWGCIAHPAGTPPNFRDFHTAVEYEKKMYVWGGRETPQGYYNERMEFYGSEMYALHIDTESWERIYCTGDIPIGRRSHSTIVYNNKMYVFGGFNNRTKQHYNDFYEFNPETKVWRKINPIGKPPCPRRRQACCMVGSKMFLFGGTSPNTDSHYKDYDFNDRALMDHSDLYILDFEPTLKTLSSLEVIKMKICPPWLPSEIKFLLKSMTVPNSISWHQNSSG